MRNRYSVSHLLIFILALSVLLGMIQLGLIHFAFEKLGISGESAILLLLVSLFGSGINLPIARIRTERPPQDVLPPAFRSLLRLPPQPFAGQTLIAANVGGCVIPVAFSIYLYQNSALGPLPCLAGIGFVSLISHFTSRPIPGLGIGIPMLIAPLSAAAIAILLDAQHSAPLAYISGTLGVLIGADLLRIKDIRRLGAPVASIGGAGTFDGIFVTGIVAVILA